MAWDIDKFDFDNINNHQVDFLVSIFGERYREDIEDVMNSYYHWASSTSRRQWDGDMNGIMNMFRRG